MAATPVFSRVILLTGPPGVGKTTLIRKACDILHDKGTTVQGFYTEELRVRGSRAGFDVVTLDGKRGALARISESEGASASRNSQTKYRVGRYNVEINEFEEIAIPSLKPQTGGNVVYVVDEIGKMELFSKAFEKAVQALLTKTDTTILATIPIAKGRQIPIVEHLRSHKDAKIFVVSKENRNSIIDNIMDTVLQSVHRK